MLKDIGLSETAMRGFRQSEATELFEAHVLTGSYWPSVPALGELALPPQAAGWQEHFAKFYLSQHNGRNLTWVPALGQVTLRMSTRGGRRSCSSRSARRWCC